MKICTFILLLLFTDLLIAQDEVFHFDHFYVKITGQELIVIDRDENIIFQKLFNSPKYFPEDLDGDNVVELICIDSKPYERNNSFTLYVFNTIDYFFLVDSLESGYTEPYTTLSEEIGETVIVTGNPAFMSLITKNDEPVLPVDCWKYDSGELFLVNDEVYEIFIMENDQLINYIESYYDLNEKNCESTQNIKAAIAASYINYLNAGELSVASQLLNKFYLCTDTDHFRKSLLELTNREY